jgi:hypothetical protein
MAIFRNRRNADMPASLPGATLVQNQANPTQGPAVIFDPLSGPKGSPFDANKIDYTAGSPPGWDAVTHVPIKVNDPGNVSTGALSTGIGYGSPPIIGPVSHPLFSNAAWGIHQEGFSDDYIPGQEMPDAVTVNPNLLYIGGGRSNALGVPTPYNAAALGLAMAGNGGSRDGGAGPAFTGFPIKTVTAPGAVLNGADVEAGWANRSGVALVADQSVFGSGAAALAAPV